MTQLPPPGDPQYVSYGQPNYKPKGMATASMICGIVAIPLFCAWYLSAPLAITAIVLGIIARGQVRRGEAEGGSMATTGIVCGSVALLIDLLVIVAVFAFMAYMPTWLKNNLPQTNPTTVQTFQTTSP